MAGRACEVIANIIARRPPPDLELSYAVVFAAVRPYYTQAMVVKKVWYNHDIRAFLPHFFGCFERKRRYPYGRGAGGEGYFRRNGVDPRADLAAHPPEPPTGGRWPLLGETAS